MKREPRAVALGRRGGWKGGPARAAAPAAGQGSGRAREAAKQRWRNRRLALFLSLLEAQKLLAKARIVR